MRPSFMRSAAAIAAIAVVVLVAPSALADVPGHVPRLDKRCPKGKQYSRKIGDCAQAKCPAGAGRTHTLVCSCGEAWGKPFRTCKKDGLAYACVAKGQACPGDQKRCPPGKHVLDAKKGVCERAFPESLRCEVKTLFDAPVNNVRVRGATARGIKMSHRFDERSNRRGVVHIPIGDRRAPNLKIIIRDSRYSPARLKLDRDSQPRRCILRVFNARGVERFVRDEYERLLGNACVSKMALKQLRRKVSFDFSSAAGPLYEPSSHTLKIGRLGADWSSMSPELAHEFAHAISHVVIDPSKNVGGDHDNWKPVRKTDAGTPEELAFEESLGDFLGLLLHRSQNQPYQTDLEDGTSWRQHQRRWGTRAGPKMEGIITAFLYEYYKPIIEGGHSGPERALADYLKVVMAAGPGQRPVRTVGEFVRRAKRRRHSKDLPRRCRIDRGKLPDLDRLARKYGVHW